jgi:hypothetical protein
MTTTTTTTTVAVNLFITSPVTQRPTGNRFHPRENNSVVLRWRIHFLLFFKTFFGYFIFSSVDMTRPKV